MWLGEEIPDSIGKLEISVPVEGLLVDYVYVFKQRGAWKSWTELAKRMDVEENSMSVQVPTLDTARYIHLLEMHIKVSNNLLVSKELI